MLNFTSPVNEYSPDSVSATVTDTVTTTALASGAGSIAFYDFGSTAPTTPITSFSGASLLGTAQLGSGGTATLSPVAHLHELRDALPGGAVHAGEPRRGVPDVHGLELVPLMH